MTAAADTTPPHRGRLLGGAGDSTYFINTDRLGPNAVVYSGGLGHQIEFELDPEGSHEWTITPQGDGGFLVENVGDFNIVGGTGRFANASGQVTTRGSRVDYPGQGIVGTTTGSAEGMISTVGSSN